MQALLRLMSNLYAPQFMGSSLWPESIKKDFVGKLPVATAAAFVKNAHLSLRSRCTHKLFQYDVYKLSVMTGCRSAAQVSGQAYRD